jgi:hydroxymethylpyrimidine/phosphomethylpyrimidine kinase
MQTALSIAGSDPTGGAGLQADLQVFRSLGVHGAGVLTALTVQDSVRVHQVLPVFPSLALDQLRVLLADITPGAIKIGMLASDDVVRNVTLALAPLQGSVPIVIDPVLLASDGTPLLERRAWPALCELMRGAALVTPNLAEAEALTGQETSGKPGCERAARHFLDEIGARAVLVKGGHRAGEPDDLLAVASPSGAELTWLAGERVDGAPAHGTGCALSAAIAAGLARAMSLESAVQAARRFVVEGLRTAGAPGKGAPFLGVPGGAG